MEKRGICEKSPTQLHNFEQTVAMQGNRLPLSVQAKKANSSRLFIMKTEMKRLLDARAAAAYLSISRALLYQWVKTDRVPSVRINSRRLFDVRDLDDFVDQLKEKQA